MHYTNYYNILYYYMHATIEGKHRNVLAGCRLATKVFLIIGINSQGGPMMREDHGPTKNLIVARSQFGCIRLHLMPTQPPYPIMVMQQSFWGTSRLKIDFGNLQTQLVEQTEGRWIDRDRYSRFHRKCSRSDHTLVHVTSIPTHNIM